MGPLSFLTRTFLWFDNYKQTDTVLESLGGALVGQYLFRGVCFVHAQVMLTYPQADLMDQTDNVSVTSA